MSTSQVRAVVAEFHEAYAASKPRVSWMGEPTSTSPLDLWFYQEVVHDLRPDLIIAVNTSNRAYLADLCRIARGGRVLSVGPQTQLHVQQEAERSDAVLVVLGRSDDDEQLRKELGMYGPLVSVGSYLIVEDTDHVPGRAAAVGEFLRRHPDFVADDNEKLYLTFNAGGCVRRIH